MLTKPHLLLSLSSYFWMHCIYHYKCFTFSQIGCMKSRNHQSKSISTGIQFLTFCLYTPFGIKESTHDQRATLPLYSDYLRFQGVKIIWNVWKQRNAFFHGQVSHIIEHLFGFWIQILSLQISCNWKWLRWRHLHISKGSRPQVAINCKGLLIQIWLYLQFCLGKYF